MIALAEKIYDEVLDLPAEERFILIDKLLQSITPSNKSIEDAWIVESEKRLQEYREGKVQAILGEEVFRKIHTRLSK
ncbi:addiction module protein [bacterium]|nr:addiction module protein [bacterium]MBU1599394.1 addiction module protein [bacterium]MBU2462358.1 addiction module protein [bacterium]